VHHFQKNLTKKHASNHVGEGACGQVHEKGHAILINTYLIT